MGGRVAGDALPAVDARIHGPGRFPAVALGPYPKPAQTSPLPHSRTRPVLTVDPRKRKFSPCTAAGAEGRNRPGLRFFHTQDPAVEAPAIANSQDLMGLQLPDTLIASVSGFRGRVGSPLTPELVTGIAAAFGAFVCERGGASEVVVGRDSRRSGPMFVTAASAGLQSVGCDVIDAGLAPTPTLLLAVEHHGAAGGIVVSASHNPADWNALKLATAEGVFLDAEEMEAFRAYLEEREVRRAAWDALGTPREDADAVHRHIERILALSYLDREALRARQFRVALDCVHGAGGVIMPALLEALGCQVVGIGLEPDGRFPRDPEPTAENLGELSARVRESGAELGLAVDPDVDRLALVDETGRPLGEDLTLALAAAVVLRRLGGAHPAGPESDAGKVLRAPAGAGATVVTNLSTSRVVEDVARAHGARLVRAPVGEIHVARAMQEVGAVVGGEGNGGVILPDLHYTRDAPLASALVLQHLVDAGGSLSGAAAVWPAYVIVKDKLPYPREALPAAYGALAESFAGARADTRDGLHLDWPEDGRWAHVRPSGTEPVVRVIAEARGRAEAQALARRVREVLGGAGASIAR